MITSCCSSGSAVSVTDTPTNTVLVVDGIPVLLPKLRDCDGDDLVGGASVVTCADLTGLLCSNMASLPITTVLPE
jgi:hypothetical protein